MQFELPSKTLRGAAVVDVEGAVTPARAPGIAWAVGLLLLAAWLGAPAAWGQMSGSAHDFSAQGWSGGEICIACHTPHSADTTLAGAPLWNHEVSVAVYEVYSSPTMDVVVGQPGAVSKLCLSCHDGTVAVDSFGGNSGTNFMTGDSNLSTILSDDHPIGIDWLHQTQPQDCSGCHDIYSGTPALLSPYALPFFGPFGSQKMECPTCHDAHNSAGFPGLLRRSTLGSELCLACHGK